MRALFYSLLILSAFTQTAIAGDLQWNGYYRAEGVFVKNPTLNNATGWENSYLLNHLVLQPKIIAMDGFNIYSRFDVLNNSLNNNQAGQVMGNYTATSPSPSATLTSTGQFETIAVTELYLNWVNEFGALMVGRMPFNFGLGMTYNNGDSMAHWLSTKDLVAYRIAMGNFYLMPAYGKVKEGVFTNEDDVNEYIVSLEYKNPETDIEMGVLYNTRVAPQDGSTPTYGNDTTASYFGTGAVASSGFNVYNLNLFVKKKMEYFSVGVEAGFMNGDSGVRLANGNKVDFAGFGAAAQLSYQTGDITLDLKLGMASGDDVDSDRFEGYFFHPNYDVAMLLFNHVLGSYDVLRSTLAGSRATTSTALNGLDTEVISNAIYFAPQFNWALNERHVLNANVTYALTQKQAFTQAQGTAGNALGFEIDIGYKYQLNEKFSWHTQIGALIPGTAWAGTATTNYRTDMVYGATSKFSINF
ncbi:MAG: hypothetical protein IPM57_00355 [Oligoflexia bacterium]|nr:hypothetical protein [Oligoflexia bacterium]